MRRKNWLHPVQKIYSTPKQLGLCMRQIILTSTDHLFNEYHTCLLQKDRPRPTITGADPVHTIQDIAPSRVSVFIIEMARNIRGLSLQHNAKGTVKECGFRLVISAEKIFSGPRFGTKAELDNNTILVGMPAKVKLICLLVCETSHERYRLTLTIVEIG